LNRKVKKENFFFLKKGNFHRIRMTSSSNGLFTNPIFGPIINQYFNGASNTKPPPPNIKPSKTKPKKIINSGNITEQLFTLKTILDVDKTPKIDKTTCVVLDLDNTIVHCIENIQKNKVSVNNGSLSKIQSYEDNCIIYLRPYLYIFITNLLKRSNVGIWTFGTYSYALKVLSLLNIDKDLFVFVYARDYPPNNVSVAYKDIGLIKKNFPQFSSYFIIDDNINNCIINPCENIWIKHFNVFDANAVNDTDLLDILTVLCKSVCDE
jgi:hypothetical protein